MQDRIKLTIKDDIAFVTLNRPEKLNALDMAMFNALDKCQKSLRKNRTIRAVILQGAEHNFCSGLDVKSVALNPLNAFKLLFKWLPGNANLAQRVSVGWQKLPVPVFAVVEGVCYGGGTQIAIGADFVIAHPDSEFSIMEGKWGIIPDMGGSLVFKHLNQAQAKWHIFSADIIPAPKAHDMGLIYEVSEQPEQTALALIEQLKEMNPDAIAANKKLIRKGWTGSSRKSLWLESYYQTFVLFGKNQTVKSHNQRKPDQKKPYKPRQNW
ncbi:crotonase/enoyl-CoA hydratase family protein [Thalassotalea agarivorans]|nr:crotonase/enoyl-CoA hydratase family protein [Thalassotalea agarivorans]